MRRPAETGRGREEQGPGAFQDRRPLPRRTPAAGRLLLIAVCHRTLIIGAGPTGLTLAVDLARSGATCRIIEQAHEANRASKAKTIQPRAWRCSTTWGRRR
ncbi:FAD-dependent monooxygenase [Streptomyces sp. NPDC047017]|uniref:FAD-dependent monooxygenase n=1 Tax=Streptomyces sp. NPDC047017 TaxID=3155024 RepID=UPI0033F6C367